MENKTVRLEFDPKELGTFFEFVRNTWNANPGTEIVSYSSGLISHDSEKWFVEMELKTLQISLTVQ